MASLTQEQLRRLARLGAMARLDQIRQEEAGIRAEFPELFGRRSAPAKPAAAGAAPKRRRKMSAADRKAVSERMRKYWAERRKGK